MSLLIWMLFEPVTLVLFGNTLGKSILNTNTLWPNYINMIICISIKLVVSIEYFGATSNRLALSQQQSHFHIR